MSAGDLLRELWHWFPIFRTQFVWVKFQQSLETLQFQQSDFKI